MDNKRERLSKLLKRRHAEIMIAEGRPVTVRELANRAGCPEENYGRWESGNGTPSLEYIPGLASVVGDEVYDIMGYPRPLPLDMSPEFRWLLEHRGNPNVADVIRKAKKQAETIIANRTVSNEQVTF